MSCDSRPEGRAPAPTDDLTHTVRFDREKCVACVLCTKACPTGAIRVRGDAVRHDDRLCIDCGECIRVCPYDAVTARTSAPSDLAGFRHTIVIPSTTLFSQFGSDVPPARLVHALTRIGFDSWYDMSFSCEMLGRAADAYLSDCAGPWPKISVTCPAIVRLIQIRYPDLLPNLVPIRAPRELTAKLARRRAAQERGLRQEEIGVFYTTPCTAIMESILSPVGIDESYLDGAFSIAELYGPIRKAIAEDGGSWAETSFSPRGLLWAVAGGETSMMRSASTIALHGVGDVTFVFDRIESGKFQSVDFIEAYICPDGCVSGPLLVEGRYTAKRTIQQIVENLGVQDSIKEEKVRTLYQEHFFDLEDEVRARTVAPLGGDLLRAVRLKKEKDEILARLPLKDCAACGAPDCRTLASDVLAGEAGLEDCVFIRIQELERPAGADRAAPWRAYPGASGSSMEPGAAAPRGGANMSKQMLLIEATCPGCSGSLTEGSRVHLDAYIKETNQNGQVRLSAVFGDYSLESDLDIPDGTIAEFRCPACERSLMLNIPCRLCGAPMASLNIRGGGVLEFCSRRGCKGHALGGFGDVDQMISLVNRMFHTPHD